jgi:hypothetical protein
MLLRPEYLSQELDRPLPTKDGGTLRTIRDACDYMTGIGKGRAFRPREQAICLRRMRQSQFSPNVWVSLDDLRPAIATATSR